MISMEEHTEAIALGLVLKARLDCEGEGLPELEVVLDIAVESPASL
jgi:hypothetical protein